MNLAMLMGTEVKGQVPTKYRVQHLDGRPVNMIVKQQMLKPINCKLISRHALELGFIVNSFAGCCLSSEALDVVDIQTSEFY